MRVALAGEVPDAPSRGAARVMRLGYLGPEGTFSEEACARPRRRRAELVPFASIHETVMAVDEGAVDRALVPIENSLEGAVSATLDALAWRRARRGDRRRGRARRSATA